MGRAFRLGFGDCTLSVLAPQWIWVCLPDVRLVEGAQALGEGGNVPFRESTLTKLLKESLGGNSKTALICTTSRKESHLEETIQSLQFAKRVKKVKNKAMVQGG